LKNGKSKAGAERDLFKKHPLTQANPKVYWFLVGAYCQPTTHSGHRDKDLSFPIPVIGNVALSILMNVHEIS